MNYDQNKAVKTPEHFEIAEKMACEIYRFTPSEQNEMVNLIFGKVLQQRQELIKETSEKLEHLNKSLESLKH